MNFRLFVILGVVILAIAACQSAPMPSLTAAPAAGSSSALSSSASSSIAASSSSSSEQVIFVDEATCMDICHVGESKVDASTGAKPQPASHIGHIACLTCHATLERPALPATHAGRMDAACKECHLPPPAK